MTILLAGCGDLGTEAALRFAALGHRVVGWRRSPGNLPAAIEGVAADLSAAGLPPVPADTSAVVVAVAADASTEEAYRAAYVQGLSNVLNALERDGVAPRRVLFVSSTAVYGDAGGVVAMNTIRVADVAAAAIVHLATMDAEPAGTYIGVDNDPADLGSVLRFLADALDLTPPPVGDAGPARAGNKRCSNSLLRSTGFEFSFPTFREGYRDILAGNGVRHP